MEKIKTPAQDVVEELLVLRQHRARPAGKLLAKRFMPGDEYEQVGLDKLEVLAGNEPYCTRDLKAAVPKSLKRTAPKNPQAIKDPMGVLIETVTALTKAVSKLVPAGAPTSGK